MNFTIFYYMTLQSHICFIYILKIYFVHNYFDFYNLYTAIYDFYNDLYNNLSDSYDCVCLWMASIIAILSLYAT